MRFDFPEVSVSFVQATVVAQERIEDIKKRGGIAVVQDPGEAMAADMPRSAIESVAVDHIVSSRNFGWRILALVERQLSYLQFNSSCPESLTGTECLVSPKTCGLIRAQTSEGRTGTAPGTIVAT